MKPTGVNLGLPWVFTDTGDNLLHPRDFVRNATLGTIKTTDSYHIARIWDACGPSSEDTTARYQHLVTAANGYLPVRDMLVQCAKLLAALPRVREFHNELALLSEIETVLANHK